MNKPCYWQNGPAISNKPVRECCDCKNERSGIWTDCTYGELWHLHLAEINKAKLAKAGEISKAIEKWLETSFNIELHFPQTRAPMTKIIKKYL